MPKTKFQEIVFCILMSFFMVFAMELYNTALLQGGLTNDCFVHAIAEIPFMLPLCFGTSYFVMDRIASRIAFRIAVPGADHPVLVTLVRAGITVCFMCPAMSLWATLIFKHPGSQMIAVWLQTAAMNFPMALCWQIFFCGPLVRFIFRALFRRQLAGQAITENSKTAPPGNCSDKFVSE